MSPESLPIQLRQARGAMSLAEAAELSEIPEERIRMYEEGVRRPYGKTLRRLADVYGVRVAELVGSGHVVRARRQASEVRRRRRRISVPAGNGVPIAVPLEVEEGQTVRLVIELVVKRREGDRLEDEAAGESERHAPTRVEEPPQAELERPPAPRTASPTSPAGLAARGAEPLRRPLALEEPSRAPVDPINELKRAYRDFRHKKR